MSIWDQFKEKASEVAKKVAETAEDVKDFAQLKIRQRELEGQIRDATEAQRAAYESIGRRVFDMYRAGQVTDSTLLAGCAQVDAGFRRIEDHRKDLDRINAEYEASKTTQETKPPAEAGAGQPGAGEPGAGNQSG